ncbi:MAG: CHAT domain-containing protein, partial [Deltaproteobacteria bacterium]|nr:CHAT domain-containing protein [Deltaproteobacteria bacterium]
MSEKKPHPDSTAHTPPQSIEEMLRERKELDRKLQANYTRDVTLMFTDIVGSTSFFDRRGDIEGRTMIQEHNDLLFPLIRAHHGTIIKTIGDAVMASFSNPEEAIRTAIDIQRTLRDHNQGKTADDHIRVRIGLNYGRGIVQDDDVFGDVVNVAARIESLAEADQILVSKPLYDQVRRTEDILCRYFDELQVKGKPEPLEIYRVVWGDEEMVMDKTRARGAAPLGKVGKPRKIFELNLSRDQDKITVSGYEKSEGEKKTIVHYENAQISPTEIDSSCLEITRLLNQANKQGKISKEILVRLQRGGQRLYDGLLTPKTRDQILKTDAEDLVLAIDDHLVHIPWELLYDGRQFFCQRFNMGRLVKTRQTIEGVKTRYVEAPLKMLILSNPKKDLPNSAQESIKLMEEVEKAEGRITATHKTGDVKTDQVKASMSHYDLVHYAGHADYDAVTPARSGWLLSNGSFTAEDIRSLAATTVMPALVFSNACHTGQTEEWKIDEKFQDNIYGLANAFLLAGVQHYVGTFWEIQDEAGSHFAMNFYHNLLEGSTVGEAVRAAREASIKRYGEETILWASYMLYGDPTTRYFDLSAHTAADESKKISGSQPPALAIPSSRRIRNKALIGTFIAA